MKIEFNCAEDAEKARQEHSGVLAEAKEVEAKIADMTNQINRWFNEWFGNGNFDILFNGKPIWKEDGGTLDPIPVDTPLTEIELIRDEYRALNQQVEDKDQRLSDIVDSLSDWYLPRAQNIIDDLEQWFNTSKEYKINLDNPAFLAVDENQIVIGSQIYRKLKAQFERALSKKKLGNEYKQLDSREWNGLVTVKATRKAEKPDEFNYALDELFDYMKPYNKNAVLAANRNNGIDNILND